MTDEIKLAPFAKEHVKEASQLEKCIFPDEPWSESALFSETECRYALCFAAVDIKSGKLAGYIMSRCVCGDFSINRIAVSAGYRKRGIAKALLNAALSAAESCGACSGALEVRQSNLAAKRLYENAGFKTVSVRKNFYVDPAEDADLMIKTF